MRLERTIYFAASPERKTKQGFVPAGHVIAIVKHITDRQVPILIDIIDKMIDVVRAGLVGMDLRDFHFAGEQNHVAAH